MKFWHPDPQRIAELAAEVRGLNVIDVGGSPNFTFPGATSVGWEGEIKLDVCREPLPFADQSVDFLFCRHTIEDLADPGFLLKEIQRVAKRGYLETPSVLCEITRGVDAAGVHCGYSHHRWMCYANKGVYVLLPKYPVIEFLEMWQPIPALPQTYDAWNFGYRFIGPLTYRVLQNEQGFRLSEYDLQGRFPVEYFGKVLEAAGGQRKD